MTECGDGTSPLPQCVVQYIKGVVGLLDLEPRIRAEVRKELEDHFEDALCRVEGQAERERCAERLIAEFGDEAVLAKLIRRGKIRCRKEMTMNISGVIGLGLFVLLVGLAVVPSRNAVIFVNIPGLIMCVGATTALGTMSFGIGDMIRGVRALRVLLVRVPPETVSSREVSVLRGLIGPVYASGLIGVLIGQINMLVSLQDPSMIGAAWATLLTCPFYAVLLAEVVLRPAVRLVEHGRLGGGDVSDASKEPEVEPEVELA